jgi:hypothetical protein
VLVVWVGCVYPQQVLIVTMLVVSIKETNLRVLMKDWIVAISSQAHVVLVRHVKAILRLVSVQILMVYSKE